MKVVSVNSMRRLEAEAIRQGVSGFELMERAGRAAAWEIEREFARYRHLRRAVIFTGRGNNAGDGLVVARMLNIPSVIFALSPLHALKGDALAHAELLPPDYPVFDGNQTDFEDGDLIVDALLGTGVSGAPRPEFAEAIRRINAAGAPVIALDLPSGLDGDTGETPGEAVRAALTVTFGFPKTGLMRGRGPELAGRIRAVPIGIPREVEADAPATLEAFAEADAKKLLAPLAFDAHKNTRGRLLIAAGSRRYPGAAALNAAGALRTGAGFVRLATPESLPALPAAVVAHPLKSAPDGCFGLESLPELAGLIDVSDAIAAGSGWSDGANLPEFLAALLAARRPLLLDADALNTVARRPDLLKERHPALVATPHPGEAARLFAAFAVPMPGDRVEAARQLAGLLGAVVVLKGPRSVVAAPDGAYSLNLSGSPALAVAGSGDVLAGCIGAWLAAGLEPFDAAKLGVFLHGRAGETIPQRGLVADDLPPLIREAMLEIAPRC